MASTEDEALLREMDRRPLEATRQGNDRARTIRVVVATPLGHAGRGGIDRLNDAIFETIEARSQLHIHLDRLVTRGKGSLFKAQLVFAFALLRLALMRLRRQVDALHIHLSDRGSSYRKAVVGRVAEYLRIPYVVHLHGAIFEEFWSAAPPIVARAINRLFEQSERIVVLGQHWADVVCGQLPQVAPKTTILPNVTRTRQRGHVPDKDGRIRITFLGELGARKGTPQLIDALSLLANRPEWTATIAGNGSVDESRIRLRSLAIDGRVSIPGWLDSTATDELLCRTDILVLPSFAEGLPMVILEAFAHAIPVVATPVGAIPEVIEDGRNGLLVPVGNVSAPAAALERLIGGPELRRTLGQAAKRDHAQRYDIDSYVDQLAAIWRQITRAPHQALLDDPRLLPRRPMT